MVEFLENLGAVPAPAGAATLTLDFDQRSRTRQRVQLDDGRKAGLFLAHGQTMREGDVLRAEDGTMAVVRCQAERVVTVAAADWPSLARAAYHFGNRHVALQLGSLWLRFQPDPVLEKMALALGMNVVRENAPFDPEPGVGHHHATDKADDGGHYHEHTHSHSHHHHGK